MSELAVGSLSGLAANSYVIDVASGSQLTQPGMVLQVVYASYSTEVTTTSTSFQATGLSLSITPSSTDSKILIIGDIAARADQDLLNTDIFGYEVTRDATQVFTEGAARYGMRSSYGGGQNMKMSLGFTYLDTPASTSSLSYAINFRNRADTNNASVTAQPESMPSTITLMEVAG